MQETWVRSLGWEDPLEEGLANHCSILVWRIPTEEAPGGLQAMGCKESDTTKHSKDVFKQDRYCKGES